MSCGQVQPLSAIVNKSARLNAFIIIENSRYSAD
ncbi:hypothetical protein BN439_2835 [Erwinia amylovora Ea644]|uniref:Uncharacterized protein n=2 Tax=Erwinia amylovora TaxID=552 RepID=A0A831ERE8_ERWAM|nr:hypothetical protein EHX00_1139 [Erwinia amylovora]CBA21764.1 hypothetical protein predicted by Glimmer/Critica [Erwinia amylovora CFBP1430]CCO83127.1 hypothetical protein BN433_2568 [Erwinia amylovora Ea266]CCO90684.1 hypothetical protein BN435_2526 [Erwinia amylovora 01SFR-BO]CCO94456.1 hypothetical protein BN437_2539 [Erwinia amylovora NBRC 12687 = CFBP 1232]CCO99797.1 hypothetical protein BN438_2526 [Erwinia amylovora UPN527]CCP03880.1 hypothetical protein BN439_2835 [Erwinia amylovora